MLTGKDVKVVPEVKTEEGKRLENQYMDLTKSPLREEFAELKKDYKEARRSARTIAEKKMIMTSYLSDVQDVACEAQAAKDWDLVGELNTIIDSLRTRTSSGYKNRGY